MKCSIHKTSQLYQTAWCSWSSHLSSSRQIIPLGLHQVLLAFAAVCFCVWDLLDPHSPPLGLQSLWLTVASSDWGLSHPALLPTKC
jgi:hypothetical protein